MPVETTVAHDAINNKSAIDKRSPVGSWEIHSWGDGKFSAWPQSRDYDATNRRNPHAYSGRSDRSEQSSGISIGCAGIPT